MESYSFIIQIFNFYKMLIVFNAQIIHINYIYNKTIKSFTYVKSA